ncbi:DUF58 domain-containing protein [Aquabacterium sp.]|uniref:DUF58 domain-containing protein n=1 Tax=Aquabacterium sp. TaxID=1872578 RepID=UPI002BB9030C|nr:DUF58 domain-containing protein [Aquabacterium sp.]HSW06786.1 DUF58 domain-containing protein [Aquabacterium sp.]
MLAERIQSYFENRLPRSDSWTLGQGNIYILPTRAGWAYAVTLLVMLLASINYQLNLGYALTFLLGGAGLVAMQQTHGNLRRLTLRVKSPHPVFAGEPALLEVVLSNPSKERNGIGVGVYRSGNKGIAWVDVPLQGSAHARLAFVPPQRGLHALPTLLAETNFPLGLFRAWTVWRPAGQVLAYPRPEQPAQALPAAQPVPGGAQVAQLRSGGEFDGVRAYRRGDPMRQVVWKKVAKSGEMVSRDTSSSASRELWLEYHQVALPDAEARLSRLAAWVLAAERLGAGFGLRLPGLVLECGSGEAQRRAALEALALWQGPVA